MKYFVWIMMGTMVFCGDKTRGKQAQVLQGIEIGIESVSENEDGTLDMAVYMYNTIPVAGFQADVLPEELFELQDVSGGLGEEKGFMMNGGKSTFLGFSIKGDMIPKSKSAFLSDNILCHLTVKPSDEIILPMEISLNPIIAGRKGVKLPSQTSPFVWEKK